MSIKLFISDVDGVLTDGSMYYTENGDEIKRFSTYDGMGFSILKQHGIKTALITSEKTNIVENRAKKMKIDYLFQGVSHNDKLKSALKICEELSINLDSVSYVGDDINCIELLKKVGIAACPKNARNEVKAIKNIYKLKTEGGSGAIREFVDYLLENKLF
jgi:YrbI family 3-deoxy-D-manno-octulosonate 8-phosphate phosphatase